MYCSCMEKKGVRDGLRDILDEAVEWFDEPSMDEFSDVMWGIGRLLAGLFGKVYVRMPWDRRHYNKVMARMDEFGCVRSKRHLIDGRCPSGV